MARQPEDTGAQRASDAQADIGEDVARQLKALYDSVEAEPLPSLFLDLLERLDAVEDGHRFPGAPEQG
ncbi:NepR family anti-sigma factor [Ensifer soli]|uniref:NepR family anti-sigma factor n=1 Tax=Ciceribacter sp. sgz301302 TaxID=3342379 RepID=UPI0035B933A0